MQIRRIINSLAILTLTFLLTSFTPYIYIENDVEYYIYLSIIFLIPSFFLFRELRLYYFRKNIIELNFNSAILILMIIISALSFYIYYLFDIQNILGFKSFYIFTSAIFPLIGLISADQFIFIQKKHILFNFDKKFRIRKNKIDEIELINKELIIKYNGKEKRMKAGNSADIIIKQLPKLNELIQN